MGGCVHRSTQVGWVLGVCLLGGWFAGCQPTSPNVKAPHADGADGTTASTDGKGASPKRRSPLLEMESICGPTEDFQDVEQYDGTLGVSIDYCRAHERPVGQIVWKPSLDHLDGGSSYESMRWCTGTLISRDLFLTAAHCFESGPNNGDGTGMTPEQVAVNLNVHFNYQLDPEGNPRQEDIRSVIELLEIRGGDRDFAIARLEGFPGDEWGFTSVRAKELTQGESLTIIQHPAGKMKKIESGTFNGYLDDGARIQYGDIDTEPGSSGSGVLSADGDLVAIHPWGGCTSTGGNNKGLPITEISKHSELIQRLIAPPCETTEECDDGNLCTVDSCGADKRCVFAVKCPSETCSVGSCDADTGECAYAPRVCDDGNECTVDSCDDTRGCVFDAEASFCTACGEDGSDACIEGSCVPNQRQQSFSADSWPLGITTEGNRPWTIARGEGGEVFARSGDIDHDEVSTLLLNVDIAADGDLAFSFNVSSEARYDFLIFSIDGEEQERWSGQLGWDVARFPLKAGTHTLSWTYDKDGSVDTYDDAVYLRMFSTPSTTLLCADCSVIDACNDGSSCTQEICVDGMCQYTDRASTEGVDLCNGQDDDCDGLVDEDFAPSTTACGVGACTAVGQTSCEGGVVVDSCAPHAPAEFDLTCDGVDDDCNGEVDDGYLPEKTSCGVGECASVGRTACRQGLVVDTCEPGPAAAQDYCDGLDNDCDGTADEDAASEVVTCGVGACAAAGQVSCDNGTRDAMCTPLAPAQADATCDGIDDDCDGETDEDFAGATFSCDDDGCTGTGTEACVDGEVVKSCEGVDLSCDDDSGSDSGWCSVSAPGAPGRGPISLLLVLVGAAFAVRRRRS